MGYNIFTENACISDNYNIKRRTAGFRNRIYYHGGTENTEKYNWLGDSPPNPRNT